MSEYRILHNPDYRIAYILLNFEFAFLYGFLDGFLDQLGIPVIVEGLFGPDSRLNLEFQLIMAGLTNIPMGHVKIIAPGNRALDDILANITG